MDHSNCNHDRHNHSHSKDIDHQGNKNLNNTSCNSKFNYESMYAIVAQLLVITGTLIKVYVKFKIKIQIGI